MILSNVHRAGRGACNHITAKIMKHRDYSSFYKVIRAREMKELAEAIKAHGGEYTFIPTDDETGEIDIKTEEDQKRYWYAPYVVASTLYFEDPPMDHRVTSVELDKQGQLVIYGVRADGSYTTEEIIPEFGHLDNIIDCIPETDEVSDVTDHTISADVDEETATLHIIQH